ncbi:type II secretion system F family protein [Ramlibacter sp. AW1]|uniref:Type II secretion system F family protein n=1 Tax=Ramlibacter aurantiacus TaxID=2801330 RepID=A0A936ZHV6_9BURK|nr:type II secretion system F family protein [Ramlibacter aurantiacus]MBL0420152.1 type II secretion system F family protein [Ramlibacter aurantiacus]
MHYRARGLDSAQQIHVLHLEAADDAEALRQLHDKGLLPLAVRRRRGFGPARRPAQLDLLLFAQELLALVAAGLSISEALDALVEKEAQPARRQVLEGVIDQLRQGHRLSAALAAQPAVFPPLFVGLIASSEGTSDLPQALGRYIGYQIRQAALRHKLASAAVYPAILLVVGMAVSAFLLGYVVPRFAAVLAGSGHDLPWASRVLMQWGQFASMHAGSLITATLMVVALVTTGVARVVRRAGWGRLLAGIPGAAPHVRSMILARLYLTLGMLLEGGIPLVRALQLCESVMPQRDHARIREARSAVRNGQPLSIAFEGHSLTTPVALRLLRVGERSGQLGALLTRAAIFQEEEATRWIDRFSRAFEPLLMTAIGLVIGLIVILLYMPVFELAGSLQ